MNKVIHPCDVPQWDGKKYPLFCKIEIKDGRLSISGVIGPRSSGNAKGGCGQVDMEFDHLNKADNDTRYSEPIKASTLRFSNGWNRAKWYKFLDTWKHWHLNDMHSECEHQEALGWKYEDHRGVWITDVDKEPDEEGNYPQHFNEYEGHACPECGYKIGSAWTRRALPAEVVEFLENLPDTDRRPAWV